MMNEPKPPLNRRNLLGWTAAMSRQHDNARRFRQDDGPECERARHASAVAATATASDRLAAVRWGTT